MRPESRCQRQRGDNASNEYRRSEDYNRFNVVDTFHLLFDAANMAEAGLRLVWKQYQVFSDAAEVFLES
ncbi:MAG: hypothetical protein K2P33_11020 [Acutalibacter sp.]|nr:hypothetical protein [Acutalibacter sp.]